MKLSDLSTKQKVMGVGALLALAAISKGFEDPKPAPVAVEQEAPKPDNVIIMGDLAEVTDKIIGGKTLDDLEEILTAAQTNDTYAYMEKEANGTALLLMPGTKVKVIETDWSKARIRVMEGKTTGAACWIEKEYLKKI